MPPGSIGIARIQQQIWVIGILDSVSVDDDDLKSDWAGSIRRLIPFQPLNSLDRHGCSALSS
jgi:hypothetical protein